MGFTKISQGYLPSRGSQWGQYFSPTRSPGEIWRCLRMILIVKDGACCCHLVAEDQGCQTFCSTQDSLQHQTFVPRKTPFELLFRNHKKPKQFSSCLHDLMKILFVQDSCKSRDYWVHLGYKLPEGLNC